MKTTLNKIRAYHPCADGWAKLLARLGKTKSDDAELDLLTILESNGLATGDELAAAWDAAGAAAWAAGAAARAAGTAARAAARAAVMAATRAAAGDAGAAAVAAAGDAARAAWAAAGDAASDAQKIEFIRMLKEGYPK